MSTVPSTIATSLFPKARRLVLGLLYGQPQRAFYLREIAERVDAGMGQVQRELARLTEAGILVRTRRGRQVFFQASESCPVFHELRGLMMKTVAGVDVLRRALEGLAERIAVAFVFGSVARGAEGSESDLDLLVVGDVSLREVASALADVQEAIGREVTPVVFPAEELREKVEGGHHFVSAVVEGEKLFVVGDEHELGEVLREPVDSPA